MDDSPSSSSSSESPATFTVFIKTADETADLPIPNLTGQVTTRHLKDLVASCHPWKPTVAQIKLIFGGRVLPDDSTLGEVFAQVSSLLSFSPSSFFFSLSFLSMLRYFG